MQYSNGEPPAPLWETAHVDEGDSLIVHLDRSDPALHIAVIPREVMEDVTQTSNGSMAALKLAGQTRLTGAIQKAWGRGDLRDMWEVTGTGLRNVQLWVTRDDFE